MATREAIDSAVETVIRFAREGAQLPPFPIEPWLQRLEERDSEEIDTGPSLLKLVETDAIPGDVLPRADNTWLALLPFQDLTKNVPPTTKSELLQNRRALVSLLVGLATAPPPCAFRWEAAKMDCGESERPDLADNRFWLRLLRRLSPEWHRDPARELTRRLITMSRERAPRVLLCVTHDVTSAGEFPELLVAFLKGDADVTDRVFRDLALTTRGTQTTTIVEIGLSFTKGKISHTFLSRLLDILDRPPQSHDDGGVQLRIVELRFGPDCSFQAKAMELLGQRRGQSSLKSVRLGDLGDLKPAARRTGLTGLLGAERGLRRVGTCTFDGFKAVASVIRNGDTSIDTIDVAFELTVENAVWLAFSLFHVDSRSRVSTVCLRLPRLRMHKDVEDMFTDEWLETFVRVLQSATADQDLADMEGEAESQEEDSRSRRFVTIKAGTPVKSGLYGGAKLLCKVEDDKEEYELIADVENSCAVVVAGVGVGWVPASRILAVRSTPSRVSRTLATNGTVKTLVLDSTTVPCASRCDGYGSRDYEQHLETVISLLSVIGGSLESLHLPMFKIRYDHLGGLLTHCPNLTELNVCGHRITTIAALRDRYASGDCKIDTLSLMFTNSEHVFRGLIYEMNDILRGPRGPWIRRLAMPNTPANWISRDQNREFTDLIGSAQGLEFLQLQQVVHPVNDQDDLVGQYDDSVDISAHPFCFQQMPLRCKLAFLSCLAHADHSALGQLDARVFARVFHFSGVTIPRRILTHVPIALERCRCCFWKPQIAKADELARRKW